MHLKHTYPVAQNTHVSLPPPSNNEYKTFKEEFKGNDWAQTVDRFHIQDSNIEEDLNKFVNSI